MSEDCIYSLCVWIEDNPVTGSVISIKNIIQPRKPFTSYRVGDKVTAKCPGYGTFPAKIGAIGDSKKELQALLVNADRFASLVRTVMPPNQDMTESPDTSSQSQHDIHNKTNDDVQNPQTETVTEHNKETMEKTVVEEATVVTTTPKRSSTILPKDLAAQALKKFRYYKDAERSLDQDSPTAKLSSEEDLEDKTEYVSKAEFDALKREVKLLRRTIEKISKKDLGTTMRSPSPPRPQGQIQQQPVSPPASSLSVSSQPSTSTASVSPAVTAPVPNEAKCFNGHSMSELRDAIAYADKLLNCVKILMEKLFSDDYILSHSISGRPGNSKLEAKPCFDAYRFNVMKNVLRMKFPGIPEKDISQKVLSVQKTKKLQSKRA